MNDLDKLIEYRVLQEAHYIIKTGETIRDISKRFNVSKSTVHKDLHERLYVIDRKLYYTVDEILKYHLEIRHIRGGESTKKKYANLK